MHKLFLSLLLFNIPQLNVCKYIEGELNTNDNWAFLARFCFLSELGEFEYHIEFREDQGVPNLLLYYDTEDQWPTVYKSGKTCQDKEAVLHEDQNQIINLTARHNYWKEFSGCVFLPNIPTTSVPKYTLNIPKYTLKKTETTQTQPQTTTPLPVTTVADDLELNFTLSDNVTFFPVAEAEIIDVFDNSSDFEMVTTNKAPIKKRELQQPSMKIYQSNRLIACHNARRFRSSRERWWFIAVSNCNGSKGIRLKYKLLMTNGAPGDYWHEHFSADEFYILPVLMAFSIAYSFLLLGIVICSLELKARQLLHTTYKIFVLSVVMQFLGILISSIAFLKYAVNGVPTLKVRRFGAIFMGCSETLFLLLLLLLAKGFTITRGRLPLAASIKLTVFMCLYVVTYISIFIYEAQVFDPGEVLYLYESPAGYGLISLRIVAWCMFIYSTVFTLKHYPEKGNFYYPFNICGTLWFVAGPAFILSANTYIDKWVRESVVCAVLQFITFGGHLSFLILTMPSVANKNFPYHVRTTQIGVMEQNGIEQFNHHPYEPTTTTATTVIVPLTRRTEEIFEGMYTPTALPIRNNTESEIISRDITMENVLRWSAAKNVPALEPPPLLAAPRLSYSNSPTISERSRRDSEIRSPPGFQDYVREVPVELFTISRMVVQNNKEAHN